jgi:hypothetical protein
MEYAVFARKPFKVQALEITKENMGEIAEMIGELRENERGIPYISVNRRIIPNIFRAHIGFWVTVMGEDRRIRCMTRNTFLNQFVPCTSDVNDMLIEINGEEQNIDEWLKTTKVEEEGEVEIGNRK